MDLKKPIQWIDRNWLWAAAFFLIMYSVGVAGHLWSTTLPLMMAMTPWFLLIMGVLSLTPLLLTAPRAFWFWALGTFLLTYFLEVLGVWTGLVFGGYRYGVGMGFPVLGVPPLIGFNWVLVCLGMILLVQEIPWPRGMAGWKWLPAVLAALLATLFDYIMEPVAIHLGYWSWAGGDIPLQNYVAWFLIALAAGLAYFYGPFKVKSRIPLAHTGAQTLFFLLLGIFMV